VAETVIATRLDRVAALVEQHPIPAPAAALRHVLSDLPPQIVDSGLVVQIWGQARLDPTLHQLATDAFAHMRSAFTGYLQAWLEQQGATQDGARARARSAAPALIGLAQGYLVHRAVLGAEAADTYLAALDELLGAL
jgi:hypothetical protein